MNNTDREKEADYNERRCTVRFTESEFKRLQKDKILTGRSIPWLLKTLYFKGELKPPPFDAVTSNKILRQLSGLANNMNQIAKSHNAGIRDRVHENIEHLTQMMTDIHALAMRDYGNG